MCLAQTVYHVPVLTETRLDARCIRDEGPLALVAALVLSGADAPVRGRPPGRPGFPMTSDADQGVGLQARGPAPQKVCGITRGRVRYVERSEPRP
jgi:hypothetical protein